MYFWSALALVLLAGAAVLSPGLVASHLPAKADSLKELLFAGITWLRVMLAISAALAVFSAWFWRGRRVVPAERSAADDPRTVTTTDLWIALGLLLAGLLLRLPNVGASLRMDELNTLMRVVKRGLPVIAAFSADGNNHMMNSLLMYVSSKIFGESEWALRLPNLVIGCLTAPALYLLLVRIVERPAAVLAGIFMAVHFRAVAYSAEARGYAGAVLFAGLACCLFVLLCREFSVRTALAYVASTALAAAFLPTSVYVPGVHAGAVVLFALHSTRSGQGSKQMRKWMSILLTCIWATLASLIVNALTLPQLLDYARERGSWAHMRMGPELAADSLHYVFGVRDVAVAVVLASAALAGWIWIRKAPVVVVAIAAPPVVYLVGFTVLRMQGSPRLFALAIFPAMLGFALSIVILWRSSAVNLTARRVLLAALLLAFIVDALPEFISFYEIRTPALGPLDASLRSSGMRGAELMLAGDQADMNVYYFPGARVSLASAAAETLADIRQASPRYVLVGMDCGISGFDGIATLGYRPLERLDDWSREESARGERNPCFVLYGR